MIPVVLLIVGPLRKRAPLDRRLRIHRANVIALALLAIGSVQMVGYVAGSDVLRGLGAATTMAPMPKVFSDVNGLETFASEFTLGYWEPNGTEHSLTITPELYAQLDGPYNRRNVYGAALSYAPRMPASLWTPVFCYGLGKQGPLRREIGMRPEQRDVAITIRTKTRGRKDSWTFAPGCTR